jgi:hypothetical protein
MKQTLWTKYQQATERQEIGRLEPKRTKPDPAAEVERMEIKMINRALKDLRVTEEQRAYEC